MDRDRNKEDKSQKDRNINRQDPDHEQQRHPDWGKKQRDLQKEEE